MRFSEKMEEFTTCDACGGECNNASGFCLDCQTPDWEDPR